MVIAGREAARIRCAPMATDPSITIRRAALADVPAIADIYNEAVLTTTATFDTEPKSVTERTQWFHSHDERHPVFVGPNPTLVLRGAK
jgi:L-amino acid N-acyltransferase YncA